MAMQRCIWTRDNPELVAEVMAERARRAVLARATVPEGFRVKARGRKGSWRMTDTQKGGSA